MINIKNITPKIERGTRKFVTQLGKSDGLVPIILLEAAVTAGRSYQAYKRGGFVEGRERVTEESIGAVFWLGGVSAFNAIGDLIGTKIFNIKNPNPSTGKKLMDKVKTLFNADGIKFDAGKDSVRDSFSNFLKTMPNLSKTQLASFKFAKILSSIMLANAFVGFVVPKINQGITRRYENSLQNLNAQHPELLKNGGDMASFVNKNKGNKTAFTGNVVQTLLSLTHKFEADAKYKLLSTDVGIAGGRAVNARNKHERTEILFRDISSIYFYMFCRGHLNAILNYFEDGRTQRLDPMSAQKVHSHLKNEMKDKSFSLKDFEEFALGKKAQISESLVFEENKDKIKTIKLEKFLETVNDSKIADRARRMAKLQPERVDGAILTYDQIQDILDKGAINDPRFLNKLYKKYTGGDSTKPNKYVPEKDLRKVKQNVVDYINDIIKIAKKEGTEVTIKTLNKANKLNFLKSGINLGLGFAISIFCLSTAIPKVQYWITKRTTGQDAFPGIEEYNKKS